MKEIEILYSLQESVGSAFQKIIDFQFENGEMFKFAGEKKCIDTYYTSKTFDDLNPGTNNRLSSSVRIREKSGVSYITHKNDVFNPSNVWIYSDELETKVENASIMQKILNKLYFKELVKIDNTKYAFESGNYEVVLELVENLGAFVEIEYKSTQEIKSEDVLNIKQSIRNILTQIGVEVGGELNSGKPELMLIKNQKNIV